MRNRIAELLLELRTGLGFLTTLPVSSPSDQTFTEYPDLFGRSFSWYPLIGLLIGGLLALLTWATAHLTGIAPPVQAALLLTVWIVLTGGLHLDGLMDSCDALFASVSVERRLQILKDVHSGAFGVIGLVLLLLLKWTALSQLGTGSEWFPALLLAPMWGRWTMVWVAQRFSYARQGVSLGSTMRQGLTASRNRVATLMTLAVHLMLVFLDLRLLLVLVAPVVALMIARWAASRLGGGLTGDLYGALCEVTEVLVLLIMTVAKP